MKFQCCYFDDTGGSSSSRRKGVVDMGSAKEPVTSPRRQWPMHTPKRAGEEDGVSMSVEGQC